MSEPEGRPIPRNPNLPKEEGDEQGNDQRHEGGRKITSDDVSDEVKERKDKDPFEGMFK